MNEMIKNRKIRPEEGVAHVQDNIGKMKDSRLNRVNNLISTPKIQQSVNINLHRNLNTTQINEIKVKKNPRNLPLEKEKSPENNGKIISPKPNRLLLKKSQSNTKENKPLMSNVLKESVDKQKTAKDNSEDEKNFLKMSDSNKTPKKIHTKPIFSNFPSPIKITKCISYRPPTFSEGEKSKIFTFINSNSTPISVNNLKLYNANYHAAKYSSKSLAYVKAYSANTNQGIVRNYNEDRVSIILNIVKPMNHQALNWPKCSFFAVYDGHGGSLCADFLRDSLHNYIIKNPNFPENVKLAIDEGFEKAEKEFIETYSLNPLKTELIDKSGSCALILLIVDDICYIANVGDSRAIVSKNCGKEFNALTIDHKPNDENETKRILENGGRVYQTQTFSKNQTPGISPNNQLIVGPFRVLPGRLSVSRTFGDAEAKLSKFGGNENVIIATPDIISFKIDNDLDFIILGCKSLVKVGDGIYDQLSDQEVTECIWLSLQETIREKNIHLQCGVAVDLVLKSSLIRRSLDNVTCVLIVFDNFEKCYNNNISNFNFSNHNSALSTFNSLNTPNNNRNIVNDIQDEKSNNNANKSYITNSTNNNSEVSNKNSFETFKFSSSNLTNIKLDQSIKDKSVNFQNKSLKSESPDLFKVSKVGLLGAPKSDTHITKYYSKNKKEKTIDINLTNFLTTSQKLKTPNKIMNQEDSLPNNFTKKQPSTTKNFKRNETLLKFQKK